MINHQVREREERVRAGAVFVAPIVACLAGAVLLAGCTMARNGCTTSSQRAKANAVSATGSGSARSPQPGPCSDELLQRMRARLDAFCGSSGCPGATLGFVLADGREGTVATGVAHKASKTPLRPTGRMLLGSIGKTYVAAVLLRLVEEQRVELDTKVSHWLGNDDWFARLPNAPDITLRMLMNHTSGIPRHIYVPRFQEAVKANPQKVWRPEELVAYVLDAEPLFPAGEGWSYADTNYILVGMIIERVTGRTYYEELSERILNPLGLADTTPADRPDLRGLVSGYTSDANPFSLPLEAAVDGRYAINPQVEWTGGGLVTTAMDLARWAWLLYGGKVLAEETRREMLQGVPMGSDPERKYGLGVMMRPSVHGLVVGHAGWMPGYVSMMAYYPDHRIALAVQVNTDVGQSGDRLRALLDSVAGDLVLREPEPTPVGRAGKADPPKRGGE